MLERVSKHWWILLLRGVLAVILGCLAIAWPGITAIALAFMFGAYALVDGIVAIVSSIRMSHESGRWVWLLLEGILGVLFGIVVLFIDPTISLWVLVVMLAAWALLTGIAAISTAWRMRKVIAGEWLWIAIGALSILFGILVAFEPVYGIFAVVYTFAFYAILTGITFIGLAFRLRSAGTTGSAA